MQLTVFALFCIESEIDQYIPEAAVSPPFTIRRKGEDPGTEPDRQLPLFESTSKDDSKMLKCS